jgi:hypothetical protein
MGDRIDELSDARSAYDRRDWRGAFDLLTAAERRSPLAPEDVELLAEAARWAREYGAMIDVWSRPRLATNASANEVSRREPHCRCAVNTSSATAFLRPEAGWVVPPVCSRTSPNALPTATYSGPSAEPHGPTKIQCPPWTTPARRARSAVGWVTSI